MPKNKPIEKSIKEYSRGIIGGLLFSFPILYTMEVWWAGYTVNFLNLLLFIIATYLLLLGYNRFAGMHPSVKWKHVFMESIEEMGLGLLISFIVLLLINRIHFTDNISEIISKITIEAMAVSIGVSIGTAQLGSSANEEEDGEGEDNKEKKNTSGNHPDYFSKKNDSRGSLLALIVLAFCGSVLVASSVGPTEEILMIAVQTEVPLILIIAIISMLLSLLVSYYSNFKGTEKSDLRKTPFEITLVACSSYSIALASSAFILWFFGRFENMSLWYIVAQCVILGAVASLGGSAARLLIK